MIQNLDPRLKQAVFYVEATDFEQLMLWNDFFGSKNISIIYKKVKSWEEDSQSFSIKIGELAGRPIWLQFSFATIEGQVVAFYEATSELIDYKMIEKWIKNNIEIPLWNNGTCRSHCDVWNFHHCIDAIREINKNNYQQTNECVNE